MPRKFDYYSFKRTIRVKVGDVLQTGFFSISLRFYNVLMCNQAVRTQLGFRMMSEIPPADDGVTIDTEKLFHCPASKNFKVISQ
jgi:hypothetical protein